MARRRALATIGEERAVEVLVESNGNVSHAARRLGISAKTIHRWFKQDPNLKALVDAERERILDKAEENIFGAVLRGDLKSSWFVLRTLGKNRGYTERREVEPPTTGPLDRVPTRELLARLKRGPGTW